MYMHYYGDHISTADGFLCKLIPVFYLLKPTDESDIVASEEAVDTFTLLHHDLNICTNFVSILMTK